MIASETVCAFRGASIPAKRKVTVHLKPSGQVEDTL